MKREKPIIIITAGPTREYLDPVRFLSNPSTGKMGFALAAAAARVGCETVLVAGPVNEKTPKGVRRVDVVSARDMLAASRAEIARANGSPVVFISSAAVADWRPAKTAPRKLKKREMSATLKLVRNLDILKTIRGVRKIGFAAETGDPSAEAARKCRAKGLDFIVANDVTEKGCGFGTTTNRVLILSADGSVERVPMMTKAALARRIIRKIVHPQVRASEA